MAVARHWQRRGGQALQQPARKVGATDIVAERGNEGIARIEKLSDGGRRRAWLCQLRVGAHIADLRSLT